MAISNYLTLSHLRKVLAALDPRFKKIESDISKTATKEYVDNNLIKNLVDGTAEGSVHSIGMSEGTEIGNYAFAEGEETEASGEDSHAEGYETVATDLCAHAEGEETEASGEASHAEGYDTEASGDYSHAEGRSTRAEGEASHAEGYFTEANGVYSHAEGESTIASSRIQHVQGKFNVEDSNETYAFIIGNGQNHNNRSNAYTLDWSGNGWFAGKVSAGTVESPAVPTNANDLVTKAYVDTAATESNLFVVSFVSGTDEETGDEIWTYDSTQNDIFDAFDSGKIVLFNYNGSTAFARIGGYGPYYYWADNDDYHIAISSAGIASVSNQEKYLGTLTDVEIDSNTLTNNQILSYNSTIGKWTNNTVSSGSTSLAGLTDTTISSSPSNGQTLVYNSSTSKWVNGSIGTRIYFTKTGNTTIDGFGQVDVYSYTVIKDGVTVTENPLSVLIQAQDILGIITNEENSENLQWLNYTGITNLGFLFTVQQFDTTATVQNVYGIYLNSNYCIGSSLPMANYQNATTSSAGLMSASDKEKLDGITLQSLTGLINELIDDALAQYGDGDTASYGYADASEEEY